MALDHETTAEPRRAQPATRRADVAARRRAVAKRRLIGVVIAVAALGGGAYYLLSGGEVNIPFVPVDPRITFTFENVKVQTTTTTGNSGVAEDRSARAAEDIQTVLDGLYTFAYAENDHWGDYGDAWSLFEEAAAAQAEADVEILTLGAEANDLYDTLTPGSSALTITVLTDQRDRPTSAIAEVSFVAGAALSDGSFTTITSEGSFFLRPADEGWLIYAYRMDRNEQAAAPPSPSAEASP